MFSSINRRSFFRLAPAFGLLSWPRGAHAGQAAAGPPSVDVLRTVDDDYPSYPASLVQETVGAAHGNLPRIKELIGKYPTLAKATWDWGYGDWESALGAASHVGNKPIAEILIANGAAPTIFSAAMLNQLDAVKAFAATVPDVQTLRGPHGITLLAHARAGRASDVVALLEGLGSDRPYALKPLAAEDQESVVGTYVFGAGPRDRFVVDVNRELLGITRVGASRRNLLHIGDLVFHPPGAPDVRITFAREQGRITALDVTDHGLVFRATRVS